MSAVLEAPSLVLSNEAEIGSDSWRSLPRTGVLAAEHRLLVDCAVCDSTHPPGTETDPACPEGPV
jgi:hypothetical protein